MRDTAPGEDRDDLIAQAGKQEIPLTLNNKFESLADDDGSDMKPLFVRYVNISKALHDVTLDLCDIEVPSKPCSQPHSPPQIGQIAMFLFPLPLPTQN